MSKKAESKLFGVCAWLAYKCEFDVAFVRIVWLILTLGSSGGMFLIYMLLALFVVDDEDENDD